MSWTSGVTKHALAGADLIVREKRGSGLASVGVYIPSFRDRESSETAGLAALMARAALRGAAGFSGDGLAAAAERLGGPITPSVGLDAVGWEMTVPSDSLVGAAELLLGVALEPDVAAREVALERALQAEDARRERDDMFSGTPYVPCWERRFPMIRWDCRPLAIPTPCGPLMTMRCAPPPRTLGAAGR